MKMKQNKTAELEIGETVIFEAIIDTWIDCAVLQPGQKFEAVITEGNIERIKRYLRNGVIRRSKPQDKIKKKKE